MALVDSIVISSLLRFSHSMGNDNECDEAYGQNGSECQKWAAVVKIVSGHGSLNGLSASCSTA